MDGPAFLHTQVFCCGRKKYATYTYTKSDLNKASPYQFSKYRLLKIDCILIRGFKHGQQKLKNNP